MTRWLDDEEQRIWRRFAAVVTLLPAALEAQLQRDAQLTHFGYWAMAMLSEAPGHSLRMSELAMMANGSQSRLSHLISRLEERGWVRRERVGEDGRGYVAVLTDAGFEKVRTTAPGHVEEVRQLIFDQLSPEQIEALDGICQSILGKLGPTEAKTC
jgi:DNA-binding MarR family transcriptional regulator